MLPAEILVLVFLASSAHALPQAWVPLTANVTSSPIITTPSDAIMSATPQTDITETENQSVATEECTDGCTFDCGTEGCMPFPVQNEVPTASGFENTNTDHNGQLLSTSAAIPASNANVIITGTPLVVGIHTSIAPTAATTLPTDTNVQPAPIEQSTQAPDQKGPSASEATASNSLLADIISIIALPDSKPSAPSNNEIPPDEENPQQVQQSTTEPQPSMTAAPGAQPTNQLGQVMTVGGATLFLTPGLSTTIGTGPAATYIEIVSVNAGQTVITLSSSGTAVTATVTNAPTTMTVASDVDASITSVRTSGGYGSSGVGVPASTSSKAEAVNWKERISWMAYVTPIFLGIGVALG